MVCKGDNKGDVGFRARRADPLDINRKWLMKAAEVAEASTEKGELSVRQGRSCYCWSRW